MGTISHIDHIAIVVNSINEVRPFYEDALGLKVAAIEELPERGIRTAFIRVGQSMIELIEPINPASQVSTFLDKRGPGLHHIAFKTSNINDAQDQLLSHQAKLVYQQAEKGAHNTLVNFIHPKSSGGVLMEIVE